MTTFADYLTTSIDQSGSVLLAGFDPQLDSFPEAALVPAKKAAGNDEAIYIALTTFYFAAIESFAGKVAAVKPNIAFFEQYGIAGLRAFASVCSKAREHKLPVIADVKRGDIGSTAEAYARAYLGSTSIFGKTMQAFPVDAVTVNPFLGADTLEPFFDACAANGKGIFVLVRTSNPGSGAFQGARSARGDTVSDEIARILDHYADRLEGSCGLSGAGAVIGATYPEELARLRATLRSNYVLIVGVGAQGAPASSAAAGFISDERPGAIVNLSRALLNVPQALDSLDQVKCELARRALHWNGEISKSRPA